MEKAAVEALRALGIDASALGCGTAKVVVVRADLSEARSALADTSRDQVVMTRVDLETAASLDRWVDVGLAKSRSEAAALFLREGLALRAEELERLSAALVKVAAAKEELRREARDVLGLGSAKSHDREEGAASE